MGAPSPAAWPQGPLGTQALLFIRGCPVPAGRTSIGMFNLRTLYKGNGRPRSCLLRAKTRDSPQVGTAVSEDPNAPWWEGAAGRVPGIRCWAQQHVWASFDPQEGGLGSSKPLLRAWGYQKQHSWPTVPSTGQDRRQQGRGTGISPTQGCRSWVGAGSRHQERRGSEKGCGLRLVRVLGSG